MYNLVIAIVLGLAAAVATKLATGSLYWGLVPGTLVFVGSYILLARRVATRIQALSTQAQTELSSISQNQREQKGKIEKAIQLLEQGLQYEKWQFLVGPELHSQIGMIKYMVGDLDGSLLHFSKGTDRNGMARALEGALWYRRQQPEKMTTAFELAVKASNKEPLVWAAYAWCALQLKDKDKALKVLSRAVEQNPSDEKLKTSLNQLQNDKRLKMRPYEPAWWQFGLELPTQPPGGRQVRFQRR